MALKSAKCPNCSGELSLPDDKDVIYCMYCGSSIIVREAIKVIHSEDPSKISNFIKLADDALSSYNFDESITYFNKALELDLRNSYAWLGKAKSLSIKAENKFF